MSDTPVTRHAGHAGTTRPCQARSWAGRRRRLEQPTHAVRPARACCAAGVPAKRASNAAPLCSRSMRYSLPIRWTASSARPRLPLGCTLTASTKRCRACAQQLCGLFRHKSKPSGSHSNCCKLIVCMAVSAPCGQANFSASRRLRRAARRARGGWRGQNVMPDVPLVISSSRATGVPQSCAPRRLRHMVLFLFR